MTHDPRSLSALFALSMFSCCALAEDIPEPATDDTTTWSVIGGDLYQFDTDIEDGGSFSVNRVTLGAGLQYEFSPALTLNIKIAAEMDQYTFRDGGAFTAPANGSPWGNTTDVTFRGLGNWSLNDEWNLFLGGTFSWSAEQGASLSDAFTGGGLFGASYTVNEDLTIGAGMQISTRIEDDLLYIPSPIIDWRISEQFFLSNMRAPAGYPASLGIELICYLSKEMNVSIGSRYEYRRFRLNDDGPAAIRNGVGTNRGFPIWLRYEWRPMPEIRLHVMAGVGVGQKLELDDRNGNQLSKDDVDVAPFVAFFLGFEF